jgi:hypothetical protein
LESVLQHEDDDLPELLNIEEEEDKKPAAKPKESEHEKESDEEMARRLAAEWAQQHAPPIESRVKSPPVASLPAEEEKAPTPMSDEEYARQLQAQWDREVSGSGSVSVAAVSGSPLLMIEDDKTRQATADDLTTSSIDDEMPELEEVQDHASSHAEKLGRQSSDYEKHGDSFSLYHYNGLRGGTLTHFRVTRLTAEEAVGASIALGRISSGGAGDLEDVVRTKWHSCSVNWLGKSPPYID